MWSKTKIGVFLCPNFKWPSKYFSGGQQEGVNPAPALIVPLILLQAGILQLF
jgi:hypothetical protein